MAFKVAHKKDLELIIGGEKVTKTVVVKKCLMKALRPDLLPFQKRRLLDTIDQYTRLVSRMMRRASLMFLYAVVRRHEEGHRPSDFDDKKTYNDDKKTYNDPLGQYMLEVLNAFCHVCFTCHSHLSVLRRPRYNQTAAPLGRRVKIRVRVL